jgi:Tfp pilus assembly protein PilF
MTRTGILCVLLALPGCATVGQGAGAQLEQKLAQDPQNRDVNLQLAHDAERSGDWLRAEQYYRRAEALGAPEAQVLPALLRVLVAARRYDEALVRCRFRLASAPEDRATRYVAAALLVALDQGREAARELSVLARQKPDDPEPYLELGRIYRDANDRARADKMFARYLALAPKDGRSAAVRLELSLPDEDILPDEVVTPVQ